MEEHQSWENKTIQREYVLRTIHNIPSDMSVTDHNRMIGRINKLRAEKGLPRLPPVLEPQVSNAIQRLNKAGHKTRSSGFIGKNSPITALSRFKDYSIHTIEGYMGLDKPIRDIINKTGFAEVLNYDDYPLYVRKVNDIITTNRKKDDKITWMRVPWKTNPGAQSIIVLGHDDLTKVRDRFEAVVDIIIDYDTNQIIHKNIL